MKINKNLNTIYNPKLHYKLDPGEPGMATPSLASQSIAKVALHEATNVRRFKKEAAQEGGIVVYSFIGLNIQFKGSFLAATSGKSKALVIVPVEEEKENAIVKDFKKNNKIKNKSIEKKDPEDHNEFNNINTKSKEINNEVENEESLINEKIDDLEVEKNILENKLSQLSINNRNLNNNGENNIQLKVELDNIKRKIRYLESQKETKKQQEYFTNINKADNITLGLINTININENSTGSLIDALV